MRRPPLTHQDILRTIERSRQRKRLRPLWEMVDVPMELYVSPEIKARLGLKCKTTTEYLAREREARIAS